MLYFHESLAEADAARVAKETEDAWARAELAEGVVGERQRVLDVEYSVFLILLHENVKNFTRLATVLVKVAALLHVVGPLLARQRLSIKGNVADET